MLAVLLLEAGRSVTIGRLMEAIYGDEPPMTSRAQIQICISALRRLFAAHGSPDIISTQSQAYAVHVPDGRFDSRRFESLVLQAKQARKEHRTDEAIARYREALALWRGPALEGMESRLVQSAASRLDEDRISANEDCIKLELDLGRHHELVGELTALVGEHPLRERLRGQLMLALYRSGRQAEALRAYRRARQTMIEELGIEPNERLQQLEHAILTSDPSLDLPVASVLLTPEPQAVVPRLLPTDIADFTGRTKQVDEILERLIAAAGVRSGFAVPIVALVGKPGIGKSTIAVHVSHRVAEHYPDGQLFADLHAGASRPVSPMQVLERFLRALGITGTALPDGLEERAEMYRALLADRKMLIVLDDVGAEGQVLPLLPGSSDSAVIISSRSRLAGLPGAIHIDVDIFDSAQSLSLLSRIAGVERVQSEPEAAVALAELCGQLPLALRIAGARLSARPHWSVGQLVERLEDETRRLDELKHGEMGIRASISLTYESVSERARCLFRRLAILDSQIFSAWLGAALLDRPISEGQDLLDDLADAQLIETTGTGRGTHTQYRFHDLIRVFARERLAAEEPAAERGAALSRVLGGLLSLVEAACRREYEDRMMVPGATATWSLPKALVDRLVAVPLVWFERERSILVSGIRQAAQAGLVEICWSLAIGAATFFQSRVYFDDWRETQRIALAAARQAGDRRGQAVMLYSAGSLASAEQRFDDARHDFETAIRLFTEIGDERGLGSVMANRGHLDLVTGRFEAAAAHFERALELSRGSGSPSTTIYVLHNLAQARLECDDPEDARRLLSEAMELVRGGVGRRLEGQVLYRLGQAHLQGEEPRLAVEVLAEALTAVQEVGDPTGEAYILHSMGLARLSLGELAEAGGTLRHALLLANTSSERLAKGRVLAGLAELALAEKNPAEAVACFEQALALFGTMSVPLDEARALSLLGDAHAALGNTAEAHEALARALAVTQKIDTVVAQRMRARLAERMHAGEPAP
ncbi:AfsR/SARP family transcriptional regulator [Streptosporangium lutulentum]|uniref:DNA-binding SARP family transcriptional activator/Flp pilus assembly protein TadD n=1 Tax=Streptosporangium lutulentum TaxID=1461250 RepID=A0ABT9Q4Q6_9ACTN|nr:BTAD domain-containing putative transcriptional regulator [Streptosporangium lutulentum]MDP9841718.1 DNA-binding SARP family transcriptional activator/Flp pilus assembly protein TadD [Streptosporangium lutulentum]